MELIDKAVMVTEIERQIKEYSKSKKEYPDCEYYEGALDVLENFRDEFLGTLKTKEVDLTKEYDNEFFKDPILGKLVNRNAGISIAKHFFELGLKAMEEKHENH